VEDDLRVAMLEQYQDTVLTDSASSTKILYSNRLAILDKICNISIRCRIQKHQKPPKEPL